MQTYVEQREDGYYIAGTPISLDSIVHAFQAGESPDEILRSFPMAGPLEEIYWGHHVLPRKQGKGGGVSERARPPLGGSCSDSVEIPFAAG